MKEEDDPNKGADSSSPNTDQTGTNDKRKHDTVNKDSESSKKKSIQSGIASIELNSAAGTLGVNDKTENLSSVDTLKSNEEKENTDTVVAGDRTNAAADTSDGEMPELLPVEGDDENECEAENPDDDDDDDDDEEDDEEDERMDTDESPTDDEENGEVISDEVYKRPATDPLVLISPPPEPPAGSSIPTFLLRKEYGNLPGYRHPQMIRHKLGGNRAMLQKLSLWAKLEQHQGCVNALNFNPSGTILASGSDDLQICLWDWYSKTLKYSFDSKHRSNVFQSKFIPLSNDSLLVTASRDGTVRMHQLSEAGVPPVDKILARHRGAVHKVDVRQDSRYNVLSCGEDAFIRCVDIRTPATKKPTLMVAVVEREKVPLYSVMSNPLKSYEFVVSGYDKYVRVYDLRQLKDEPRYPPLMKLCPGLLKTSEQRFSVSSAVYNYCGSEILASYNDHNVFLFDDINTGSELQASVAVHEYEGHRNNMTVKSVNFFGPRSEFVVSGSDCGKVFFWDKESQKVVHFLEADGIGAVNVLEPHPFDPVFATSGLEHSIKVWAPTAEEPTDLQELLPAMEKNANDRKREFRLSHRNQVDEGEFFMMLMNQLRSRATRERRRPVVPNDPNEAPPLEENSDSDESDDAGGPDPVRCATA